MLRRMTEPRDQNKFIVRMPDGMRDRIRDAAVTNKRSMNAEIIARLEASFEDSSELDAAAKLNAETRAMLAEMKRMLGPISEGYMRLSDLAKPPEKK